MNEDDIIRLAQEAGWQMGSDLSDGFGERLVRFTALIEEHLRWDGVHTCHDECGRPACVSRREAVQREREACAKVAENGLIGHTIAKAIRARD